MVSHANAGEFALEKPSDAESAVFFLAKVPKEDCLSLFYSTYQMGNFMGDVNCYIVGGEGFESSPRSAN